MTQTVLKIIALPILIFSARNFSTTTYSPQDVKIHVKEQTIAISSGLKQKLKYLNIFHYIERIGVSIIIIAHCDADSVAILR